MSTREDPQSASPGTARRAVLTGGVAGLAAVAGSALASVTPASAATTPQPQGTTPSITDWVNVTDFGAKGDGKTDNTVAFSNAIAALPTVQPNPPNGALFPAGVLYVPPGNYVIGNPPSGQPSDVTPLPYSTRLVGSGSGTILSYYGSGDAIRLYSAAGPPYPTKLPGGGVEDLVIDGTNAGGGAAGLHIGNGSDYHLARLRISNFSGSGSVGLHLDNVLNDVGKGGFTEKMTADVQLYNNATHVLIENSAIQPGQTLGVPGADSFMYNDFHFHIDAQPGQNGIVLQNGAFIENASLTVRGNFNGPGPTSPQAAVLTIQGADSQNNPSNISHTFFDFVVESDQYPPASSGPTGPTTIAFGRSPSYTNYISDSTGQIVFSDAAGWTKATVGGVGTQIATATQQFRFSGVVDGDEHLSGVSVNGTPSSPQVTAGAPVVYAVNSFTVPSGGTTANLCDGFGDFFEITLTGDISVAFGSGGAGASTGSLKGPQRKTVIITQGPQGGATVSWPSNVLWAHGSAPQISAAAGAVDMYRLETIDGQTWIGDAVQSVAPGQKSKHRT